MAIIDLTEARGQRLAKDFSEMAPKMAQAPRRRTTAKPEEPGSQQRDRGRQSLLPRSDEHAKERVIGYRDIVPLSFMERGLRAGQLGMPRSAG